MRPAHGASPLAAAVLLTGLSACFSAQPLDGPYHCVAEFDCLDGFTCFEGACCRQDRLTLLCEHDPCLKEGADADRDGFPVCAGDCNDFDATVYPGAPELCDGKDNDCNGTIDEGATIQRYLDRDGDGHGSVFAADAVLVCADGPNLSATADDCDDEDPEVYGGAAEVCDGKDNDCDGQVDEGVTATWYRDVDGDGYGQTSLTLEACDRPMGYAPVGGDCQDMSALIHPGRPEQCNGLDDNCNGQVDEGVKLTFFPDADGDGYGGPGAGVAACDPPAGHAANQADCDDADPLVNPGVAERCNGLDDDCDGQVDEGVTTTYYRDADGDGFGRADLTVQACAQPQGYADRAGDCNDASALIHPAMQEVCDGADNDCDGLVDEGLAQTFFRDADNDGYGTPAQSVVGCAAPAGYVQNALDCDDTRATVWPGAPEACDGVDNDCDGMKDNAPLCGPKVDQAEVAGAWGAGMNALGVAVATVSGCIANTSNHAFVTPTANTADKVAGAASIQSGTTDGFDFFLYFPLHRTAGWNLRFQQLRFQVKGLPTGATWAVNYRQPVVLFCAQNGAWARYEPPQHMVGATFVPVTVTVPNNVTPGGGFTYSAGFAWTLVDWVELHANPSTPNVASLLVDDFRFVTP